MKEIYRNKLLSHKLIMVSGKGGTGKTLVAASLAKLAAEQGKRVLLAESCDSTQLSPLVGQNLGSHQQTQISSHLFAINLNSRECFREYVEDHLGLKQLYRRVFNHRIMKSFVEAIPGLNEIMILGKICNSLRPGSDGHSFDMVILDAPASGHFYGLVSTPDAIVSSGLTGPLMNEINKIRQYLANPELCTSLLVAIPEALVINETLEFLEKLQQSKFISVGGVLLNRSYLSDENRFPQAITDFPDQFSAAKQYLQSKFDSFQDQHFILQNKLNSLEDGPGMACLPEFGVIPEPLNSTFQHRLWEHCKH